MSWVILFSSLSSIYFIAKANKDSNTAPPIHHHIAAAVAEIAAHVENETFIHLGQNHENDAGHPNNHHEERMESFQLVAFNWEHVKYPYMVGIWLLAASLVRVIFHLSKRFGNLLPDSAILIIVGLGLGFLLKAIGLDPDVYRLNSDVFFLFLLPPIIYDAGYFMPNRYLFENVDSVLLFAVIGTIWNTIAISATLYVCSIYSIFSVQFTIFEILLFSALISAVDPVAVIAVFEEIHVNEFLFINVFGEALFNDGVAAVLYFMFKKFMLIIATVGGLLWSDYVIGLLSFLVMSLGGVLVGIIFAFIVSFITKYTDHVRILAPVFIFIIPYLAYLTAEMLGLSAILAIAVCGMMMKQYVTANLSHDAASAVKYFTHMLAQSSETVIFIFLGLGVVSSDHNWDTYFVVITLVGITIFRIIGVLVQCFILNQFRTKKFSAVDQFVLCYGGLRGAIAFGLVVSLPSTIALDTRNLFVTTCIVVIYVTVLFQGITIRPILSWLKVERKDDKLLSVIESINNKTLDYVLAGIEDIIGQTGKHSVRDDFERFNAKFLRPLLTKRYKRSISDSSKIVNAYQKITLHEAVSMALQFEYGKQKHPLPPITPTTPKTIRKFAEEAAIQTIDQHGNSNLDTQALYNMFSQLLDRKLHEIRETPPSPSRDPIPADIQDDYIGQMRRDSRQDLPTIHENPGGTLRELFGNGSVQQRNVISRRHSQPPGYQVHPV